MPTNLAENEFEGNPEKSTARPKMPARLMFSFDLAYAGVFRIVKRAEGEPAPAGHDRVPATAVSRFAREIIATAVRDGGFPATDAGPGGFCRSVPPETWNGRLPPRRRPAFGRQAELGAPTKL